MHDDREVCFMARKMAAPPQFCLKNRQISLVLPASQSIAGISPRQFICMVVCKYARGENPAAMAEAAHRL